MVKNRGDFFEKDFKYLILYIYVFIPLLLLFQIHKKN